MITYIFEKILTENIDGHAQLNITEENASIHKLLINSLDVKIGNLKKSGGRIPVLTCLMAAVMHAASLEVKKTPFAGGAIGR